MHRSARFERRVSMISMCEQQCVDNQETSGEVALYASQPGETWIGRVPGAMALEQFSVLFLGRTRSGAGQ